MKIISKFHDYYDSAAIFYDNTIMLKRETNIIDYKEIKNDLPYKMISLATSRYKRRNSSDYDDCSAAIEFLYFCGKVYPLFVIYESKDIITEDQYGKRKRVTVRSNETYYSNFEELKIEIENRDLSYGYAGASKRKIKEWEDILKNCVNKEIEPDIFRQAGALYFKTVDNGLMLYPVLKDLTKSFKMEASIVYQEIEMYIGGVLGIEQKEIIEISDIDKRNSKGFDNYSFKKRKV